MAGRSEKRKNRRRGCMVPVEGKRGTAFEDSQTIDISKGGAGLIIRNLIPVNTEMAVEINLSPESDPILAMGQVRWVQQMPAVDSYRVGLSFTDVKSSFKSRLNRFLK